MNRSLFMVIPALILLLVSGEKGWSDTFDWRSGNWGIKVTNFGAEGSPVAQVAYPGGNISGKALEVYYRFSDNHTPQLWVFLTDGFWRQVSDGNPFGTSYRLFQYHSSQEIPCYEGQQEGERICDRTFAREFKVVGLAPGNQMEIELAYENNSLAGDRFDVLARVVLMPPTSLQTQMEATITVTNVSGYDVQPSWQGHRTLAEQWELFGISTMFVADNLTGALPEWYTALDPDHGYVGITHDTDFLNDGYSKNGGIYVSSHDAKTVIAGEQRVILDHAGCPYIFLPEYEWYRELVMKDHFSETLRVVHQYAPGRSHLVRLISCGGMTEDTANLKWAVTYNRDDKNMVDGDNVQIKLGMDSFLNLWPDKGSQMILLNLRAGKPHLTEVVMTLAALAGRLAAKEIKAVPEMNEDGRRGLAEALYILQSLGQIRPWEGK